MIGISLTLHGDMETLKAAIVIPAAGNLVIDGDQAATDYGTVIGKLLQVSSILMRSACKTSIPPMSLIRRSIMYVVCCLAMVEDVRAVVIKLAERIACLREVQKTPPKKPALWWYAEISTSTPLANRLGIRSAEVGVEDLSFRYLQPRYL